MFQPNMSLFGVNGRSSLMSLDDTVKGWSFTTAATSLTNVSISVSGNNFRQIVLLISGFSTPMSLSNTAPYQGAPAG
jgi:hypothetical protein